VAAEVSAVASIYGQECRAELSASELAFRVDVAPNTAEDETQQVANPYHSGVHVKLSMLAFHSTLTLRLKIHGPGMAFRIQTVQGSGRSS